MQQKITETFTTQFEADVFKGLSEYPKHLSSQYFYDKKGDKLFQDIMNMPEYYLTNSELEIFKTHKKAIADLFAERGEPFNLIELGAGDGLKTRVLLKQLLGDNNHFTYSPIDISQNALDQLEHSLLEEFPGLSISPHRGTYFESLEHINQLDQQRKVLLFLGSNIGNLLHPQAVDFLKQLQELMRTDDLLFVGFDQKKHPKVILDAYNDAAGITEAFNKNILHRINRELQGNFDPDKFLHWEVYDPESGTAKSYLVSREDQEVFISKLDLDVKFRKWETIHTEISQKYDDEVLHWLASEAGLYVSGEFSDSMGYYKDYVLKKH
ncbi:L-histidine N(alpha)-methyltransferase [Poritiphilus flavus]|uniref:L-histidine N(Alpha)-methyltransferase n=1 Tax=Poritiphilus flavus TaxID=2697053 RepID=A0A6L9EGW9_9FLAO|nr:L-histidine N(alpha)-methyltransferase [Poritiphilus flavus]NAS13931.1 L-histidine N(alpha)-methyltransferase [Poritiphilus flavus]